ncbi:MAG: ORF6N domain-containing protein [Bacteroidetes bacterium]|nr:ORF6N domain-containing protein [Bacteroidota bacterium]
MLSIHLAELYGVGTIALIQAVKRNIDRFPKDFISHMFIIIKLRSYGTRIVIIPLCVNDFFMLVSIIQKRI